MIGVRRGSPGRLRGTDGLGLWGRWPSLVPPGGLSLAGTQTRCDWSTADAGIRQESRLAAVSRTRWGLPPTDGSGAFLDLPRCSPWPADGNLGRLVGHVDHSLRRRVGVLDDRSRWLGRAQRDRGAREQRRRGSCRTDQPRRTGEAEPGAEADRGGRDPAQRRVGQMLQRARGSPCPPIASRGRSPGLAGQFWCRPCGRPAATPDTLGRRSPEPPSGRQPKSSCRMPAGRNLRSSSPYPRSVCLQASGEAGPRDHRRATLRPLLSLQYTTKMLVLSTVVIVTYCRTQEP